MHKDEISYKEIFDKVLLEAKEARNQLTHKPGILVGNQDGIDLGVYLSNYANCLHNRMIDIFDDSIFLIENNRIPAACTISRGMIETYAFYKLLLKKVEKILTSENGKKSVDESVELIMNFTNSSRFKESEQKKIVKGIYDPKEYEFTEQAKHRFENMLASSEHVMNSLRDLYKDEMHHRKTKESHFEIIYDALSEWVHPSQTSIFHNYVPETHMVPSSMGTIHIYDSAKMLCAQAIHFIVDSVNIYNGAIQLANEISRRDEEYMHSKI